MVLGVAVALAVLDGGGYADGARVRFGVLALVAAGLATAWSPAAARRAARSPVVLVLLALGALGAMSALWAAGPGDALRWALVTMGYAGVVVAAATVAAGPERTRGTPAGARGRAARPSGLAVLAADVTGHASRTARLEDVAPVAARAGAGRPRAVRLGGVEVLAAGVAVLAFASGVVGLVAVVRQRGPYADLLGGSWRPGGTLEYSAALALAQVSALPALLTALAGHAHAPTASGSTPGVCSRGAGSAPITHPWRVRAAWSVRDVALRGAAGAGLAVALAVLVLAGGRVAWALAALVVLPRLAGGRERVLAGGVLVVAPLGLLLGGLHGRGELWGAGLDAWRDHPWLGAGADAFAAASAPHQAGATTIRFAHDLPLELLAELGVLGGALALALYATTGRLAWRARGTRAARLLGPAALAFPLASLVDWPWHLAGSGALWAVAIGGLLGASGAPARPD